MVGILYFQAHMAGIQSMLFLSCQKVPAAALLLVWLSLLVWGMSHMYHHFPGPTGPFRRAVPAYTENCPCLTLKPGRVTWNSHSNSKMRISMPRITGMSFSCTLSLTSFLLSLIFTWCVDLFGKCWLRNYSVLSAVVGARDTMMIKADAALTSRLWSPDR